MVNPNPAGVTQTETKGHKGNHAIVSCLLPPVRSRRYKNRTMNSTIRLLLAAAGLAAATAFAPAATTVGGRAASVGPLHAEKQVDRVLGDTYKKVFVAGGSKGVGRIVVDKLAAAGAEVVALVRSDEAVSDLSSIAGVTAIKGDAFDYKSVEGAMDGCDAAITTLGGGTEARETGKWVDYTGNNNVIEAAGILGVTRCVCIRLCAYEIC